MSKKIQTKWINNDAITGAKIKLANNESLRASNATNSEDINILKVSGDNSVHMQSFFKTPSTPPTEDLHVANKKFVHDRIASTNIENLADVNISSVSNKQALIWNGTDWVNSSQKFADLADVNISSAAKGDVLKYDDGKWKNSPNVAFGTIFSFHLKAKGTVSARCLSALRVPPGWTLMAGIADPTKIHRLGSSVQDMIISHNVGQPCWDLRILEHDFTGPMVTQYINIKDLTAEDVLRNNISSVGSGPDGKTNAFRINDMQNKLQVGNDGIVIVRFL
jgi:hypothetical protein